MESMDSIKRDNQVSVIIYGESGEKLFETTGTGYHSIEAAIRDAISNASLSVNPEDCVYEVTNDTTNISHRYRINAHGNLKLIV